jgi:hypothetical protein
VTVSKINDLEEKIPTKNLVLFPSIHAVLLRIKKKVKAKIFK